MKEVAAFPSEAAGAKVYIKCLMDYLVFVSQDARTSADVHLGKPGQQEGGLSYMTDGTYFGAAVKLAAQLVNQQ